MRNLLLVSLACAAASLPAAAWEVTGSRELGTLPGGGQVREVEVSEDGRTARITAILFSSRSYDLRVVDSPDPGQTKLSSVLAQAGCIAGVNGGYFHPDFRPVGLAIADGKQLHPFEKAKLLSGVLAVRGARIEMVRSSRFQNSGDVRQAIQAGPMLLDSGAPSVGLNAERTARRTVAATDGRGQWGLLYMTSVTLADAAGILTIPALLGPWNVMQALNLDGGSSSGLWAESSPHPVTRPELGHVRNYIGIAPKP
jgi:uncharacterized protein YigE (DUF2233 family)